MRKRRGSRLLDRGNELMLVYPAQEATDRYGNIQHFPRTTNPLEVWVNISTDRQQSAELPGQVDVKVLKVSFRQYPQGEPHSYDRIILRGEEWDLAVPPVKSGLTWATRHFYMILRSRQKEA